MNVTIRQEKDSDHEAVFDLIEQAFRSMAESDHGEQFLVEKLRKSTAFIPELSIVAEFEGKTVGYILLTKIKITNDEQFESLAMAPVAVLPEFHNRGVGGKLILSAHQKAKELGYKSVVVLGHHHYYPKFGYQQTTKYNIELPFQVDAKNCMVIELVENGLNGVSGMVEYAKEFYE